MVTCEICNKRMPTQKVLDQHKAKSHATTTPVQADLDAPVGAVNPVFVQPEPVNVQADTVEMVDIISADGRKLDVAINSQHWEGKVISIPKELDGEIRRLLETGGFYLKN